MDGFDLKRAPQPWRLATINTTLGHEAATTNPQCLMQMKYVGPMFQKGTVITAISPTATVTLVDTYRFLLTVVGVTPSTGAAVTKTFSGKTSVYDYNSITSLDELILKINMANIGWIARRKDAPKNMSIDSATTTTCITANNAAVTGTEEWKNVLMAGTVMTCVGGVTGVSNTLSYGKRFVNPDYGLWENDEPAKSGIKEHAGLIQIGRIWNDVALTTTKVVSILDDDANLLYAIALASPSTSIEANHTISPAYPLTFKGPVFVTVNEASKVFYVLWRPVNI